MSNLVCSKDVCCIKFDSICNNGCADAICFYSEVNGDCSDLYLKGNNFGIFEIKDSISKIGKGIKQINYTCNNFPSMAFLGHHSESIKRKIIFIEINGQTGKQIANGLDQILIRGLHTNNIEIFSKEDITKFKNVHFKTQLRIARCLK